MTTSKVVDFDSVAPLDRSICKAHEPFLTFTSNDRRAEAYHGTDSVGFYTSHRNDPKSKSTVHSWKRSLCDAHRGGLSYWWTNWLRQEPVVEWKWDEITPLTWSTYSIVDGHSPNIHSNEEDQM